MERMILALAAVVALQMVGLIVVAVVLLRPTVRVKIDRLHVGDVNSRTNETATHPTLEQLQYGGREVDRMLMAREHELKFPSPAAHAAACKAKWEVTQQEGLW